MSDIMFTLDEYKELLFYMQFAIDLTRSKKEKHIIPFDKAIISGSVLRKYDCTGFFNYKEVGDDVYSYTLTRKGFEYLSSIL